MWYLIVLALGGATAEGDIGWQMPSYEECRIEKVGIKALDPKGVKWDVSCVYIPSDNQK